MKRDWEAFKVKLSYFESGHNPLAINTLGYLGLYQFGELAFQDIYGLAEGSTKYNYYKKNIKRWDPRQQDEDLKKLYINIVKYFDNYLVKYKSKVINGIKISPSGMLAAAHLVGVEATKKYLDNLGKHVLEDAYGTNVEKYIKLFCDYDVQLFL
jgi:hypothetical protein